MSLVAQPPLPREHTSSIPAAGSAAPTLSQRGQPAHIQEPKRPLNSSNSSSSSSSSSAQQNDSNNSNSSSETDSEDDMISPQPCTGGAAIVEQAPALPAKSSLRASRMLEGLPHKLSATEQPPFSQTTPHDVYLSSEEDASSSADDFSDFDLESGSEDAESSSSSHKRRGSHEDTARVVSVIFSGKPSIVDLPPRSTSPSSVESHPRPLSRLQRTFTDPTLARRMSTSSSVSGTILHPPRTSSMLPSRLEKQKPQFLHIDPFAKPDALERHETDSPRPKTPTAMFKRTLSLVRKRSKPHLGQSGMHSRDNLSIQTQLMEQVAEEPRSRDDPASASSAKSSVTYNDIIKSAKRRTQTLPMSPMSPSSDLASPMTPATPNSTRSRLRNGFSAAARRRSSIKA